MRRAALAAVLLLGRGEAPLPEGNAYVRGLVEKQRHREAVLDQYTYDLVSVREELDDGGNVKDRETSRYEIYFVKGRPVRQLVEEDGRPLSARRQAREDREAREMAEAVRSGRAVTEQPRVRLSAILDRYDFHAVRREDVAGRTAVVLEFQPRPGDLALEGDRYLRRLGGRVWVDDAEREIVRTEITNVAPIKVGGGLGASVSSFSIRIDFRKVDDAVWLPAEDETLVSGRVLLFKKFRRRFRRTYGNYRRFSVESEESPSPLPSPSPTPSPFPSPSPSPSPSV
jgi:hypothetical protein